MAVMVEEVSERVTHLVRIVVWDWRETTDAGTHILAKALPWVLGTGKHPLLTRRETLLDRLPLLASPNGRRASGAG